MAEQLSQAESAGAKETGADESAAVDALRTALAEELAAGEPSLIEVAIEPGSETSPWNLIHMKTRPSLSR